MKQILPNLRGSKANRAVGHWLLSVNYFGLNDYEQARRELLKAEKLSNVCINALEEKVRMKIKTMFDDPIFALVPPIPNMKSFSGNLILAPIDTHDQNFTKA